MVNVIIFLVAIFLTIFIGIKTKINMGVIALFFALLIGMFCLNMNASAVFKSMNAGLFLNMFSVMLFYGIAMRSGCFDVLAGKILYKFRGATKIMPLVGFIVGAILQACGNDQAHIILVPFIYGIAIKLGYDASAAVYGVWAGMMVTMHLPWNGIANIDGSVIRTNFGDDAATKALLASVAGCAVFFIIRYVLMCITKKMFKFEASDIGKVENPQFSPEQKKAMTVVACVILLTIIPMLIQIIKPNPATKWFTRYFGFYTLAILGAIVLLIMRQMNSKDAIKVVPWNPLMLVTGMAILFGLCQPLGIVDLLAEGMNKIPNILVAPGIVLVCGFLSFFVSAMVLGPMFLPLGEVFATAAGVNPTFMFMTILNGGGITSCSPVSGVGAVVLASVPDAEAQTKISGDMAKFAVVNLIAYTIYTFIIQFIVG